MTTMTFDVRLIVATEHLQNWLNTKNDIQENPTQGQVINSEHQLICITEPVKGFLVWTIHQPVWTAREKSETGEVRKSARAANWQKLD